MVALTVPVSTSRPSSSNTVLDRKLRDLLRTDFQQIKGAVLRKTLKQYRFLVIAFLESLHFLEKGELERFDALVGENACQIRAVRMALIYSDLTIDILHYRDQGLRILHNLDELLESRTISRMMTDQVALRDLFAQHELELTLSSDMMFSLAAYFLCEMKESAVVGNFLPTLSCKDRCSPLKIKDMDSEISVTFARNLAQYLRRYLSCASADFIRILAKDLKEPSLEEMTSEEFETSHNALTCIPMFWTYKTLVKAAQVYKIPLVVRIRFIEKGPENGYILGDQSKVLFFRPEGKYVLDTPSRLDLERAAWVIEGVSEFSLASNYSILEMSVENAILAGAADHPQYPQAADVEEISNREREYFKSFAIRNGFSQENPATFFIQHVYPSRVCTQIS